MSHHIDKHGEQAAAIFARTDPWHRLGVTVAGRAFTAQEAMTLGRLGGWDVHKVPLTAHELTSDGVTALDVPGYATVRTNPFTGHPQALGVVGAGYHPSRTRSTASSSTTWPTPPGPCSTPPAPCAAGVRCSSP